MADPPATTPPVVVEPTDPGPEKKPVLEWTEDLCDNVLFTHAMRPIQHAPDHGGEGSHGRMHGFYEFRTTRPVRAMAILSPGHNGETCRYHYAKRVVRTDGFYEVLFCSQPSQVNRELRKASVAHRYARKKPEWDEEEHNPEVPLGFNAFVGAYHAPLWTEALFSSFAWICGGGRI
jgi:hypothetical protein